MRNAYSHTYGYSHRDAYGNGYSNGDSYSYGYSNGDCDRSAAGYTNATASGDTAAATVVSLETVL